MHHPGGKLQFFNFIYKGKQFLTDLSEVIALGCQASSEH